MVGLLVLVCLLDERAEFQEVRTADLRQVLGDSKAVVPRVDWVAVGCVQIAAPVLKYSDWNVRVVSREKADFLQPQRFV